MEVRKLSEYRRYVKPILYYDDLNPASRSVLMLLKLLDVDIELRLVELVKGQHLTDAYKKINPFSVVPTLIHGDIKLTGHSILLYVCENFSKGYAKQLLSTDCYKRQLRIINRLFFETRIVHRVHRDLMTDLVLKTIANVSLEKHRKQVEDVYDSLETFLENGDFMAGNMVTLADIAMISSVAALDMMFRLKDDQTRWEKLYNWFRHMRAMPTYNIISIGIDKQREVVEHYAQFSFSSVAKRFSDSLRVSYVPRLTLHPTERCSVEGEPKPSKVKQHDTHKSEQSSTEKETYSESHGPIKDDLTKSSNALKNGIQRSEHVSKAKDIKSESRKVLQTERSEHSSKAKSTINESDGTLKGDQSISSKALQRNPEKHEEYSKVQKRDTQNTEQFSREKETSSESGGTFKEYPPKPPKIKRQSVQSTEQNLKMEETTSTISKSDGTFNDLPPKTPNVQRQDIQNADQSSKAKELRNDASGNSTYPPKPPKVQKRTTYNVEQYSMRSVNNTGFSEPLKNYPPKPTKSQSYGPTDQSSGTKQTGAVLHDYVYLVETPQPPNDGARKPEPTSKAREIYSKSGDMLYDSNYMPKMPTVHKHPAQKAEESIKIMKANEYIIQSVQTSIFARRTY